MFLHNQKPCKCDEARKRLEQKSNVDWRTSDIVGYHLSTCHVCFGYYSWTEYRPRRIVAAGCVCGQCESCRQGLGPFMVGIRERTIPDGMPPTFTYCTCSECTARRSGYEIRHWARASTG